MEVRCILSQDDEWNIAELAARGGGLAWANQ